MRTTPCELMSLDPPAIATAANPNARLRGGPSLGTLCHLSAVLGALPPPARSDHPDAQRSSGGSDVDWGHRLAAYHAPRPDELQAGLPTSSCRCRTAR